MNKNIGLIFLGAFIAIGLSLSGYFVGQTLYNAKVALNTAVVRGLAEKRVSADTATWTVNFSVSGKDKQQIPALYQQAQQHQQHIVDILKESGFSDSEIHIGVIDYSTYEYRNDNQVVVDQSHHLAGEISIETQKVSLVAEARKNLNALISQGITLKNNAPIYKFTQLNKIKPELLKAATKNARIAANEFASNAGVSVGSIRNARQGNFQITDIGEEYGDSMKIEKNVRVVTSIEFYLTDK